MTRRAYSRRVKTKPLLINIESGPSHSEHFIDKHTGILITSHKSHPCAGTGNIKTLAPVNAFSMIVHFFRKSPAGSRFLKSMKFTISWCAEPKREAMFHFWSQISWNLRCAEPKPHITLLHFGCSRWGLPKKTGIGTPTHYGARFFFLLPCACQYTFLIFSTPPKR